MQTILDLPLNKIYPHPDGNVRGEILPAQTEEMALSIQLQRQVIQPLLVFSFNGGWAVIDGHVRRAGAKHLSQSGRWPASMSQTLPCIVRDDLSREQHRAIMLATASTRYELNPVDEGLGYKRLMVEQGLKTAREVADYCGVPPSRVESRLTIVNLAPPVVGMFREGRLQLGAAKYLSKISDPQQQTDLACTLTEMGDLHLDAIAEACQRVVRDNGVPKPGKNGLLRAAPKPKLISNPPPPPSLTAPANGNGAAVATAAPVELYDGGSLGMAEIQAAVGQTCRACTARQKLPVKVAWGKAERSWLQVCDSCEAVKRVSTACDACPLAKFLDVLLEETEIQEPLC